MPRESKATTPRWPHEGVATAQAPSPGAGADPRNDKQRNHTFAPQKPRFSADPRGPRAAARAQLPLSPALRAQQATELSRRLAPHVEGTLDLVVTDNRSVMVSVRRSRGEDNKRFRVRVHHLFADAPEPILGALARYIANDCAEASRTLSAFVERHDDRVRDEPPKPRAVVIRTAGKHYDLAEIFARLNARYFDGRVDAAITWGRNAKRGRARSSVRLGSFCVEEHLIRIHPGLDQRWVPPYYLEWVVYHEMLHVMHPIRRAGGRRVIHSEAFLADEKRFEQYDQAHAWERRSVAALLCI